MRFFRSDKSSLRNKDTDKRNSHINNSETHFHFSNRNINFPKEKEKKGEVSFCVDRAGVKNAPTADGCTKNHGLPIRYTSILPLQKLTDHTKEAENESITSKSKVQPTRQLGKRLENIPRKHVLRTQLSFTSKTATARRYHVDDDPRFSALKPGIISESLRDALGISLHQLPLYIYNMRRLGYPPGHLENARRQQSGILIFTNDRCEITPCGKVLEEGEVNDEQEEVLFDVDKLIDFPGFNIHAPDGTLDECESLDLPFMQADHSKEEMIRLLSSAHGKESMNDADKNLEEACLKERERSPTIHFDSKATEKTMKSYSEEKMSCWLSEMGLSPADGWFVLDSLPESDDDYFELSTCPNSPDKSLPSEQSQTHSVHEMQMPNAGVSLDEYLTPPEKPSRQVLPSTSRASTVELDVCSDGEFSDDVMTTSGDFEEMKSIVYGGSLDVSSGTPVAVDPMFGCLPDASCFSWGMSEALPFENLPNATGAFGKLRKVLSAARCRRTRLNRATDAIR